MENREIIQKMIEDDRIPQKPKRKYNLRDPNEFRYIPRWLRYEILTRQHWTCNMCGCKLKYSKNTEYTGEVAHIDHIVPFSKRKDYDGDINSSSNLQALCPSCNLSKSKKEIQ